MMQTTSAASHSGAWLTPKASPRRRPGETPSAAAAQTGTLDASLQSMLGDVEADVEMLRERREVSALRPAAVTLQNIILTLPAARSGSGRRGCRRRRGRRRRRSSDSARGWSTTCK